MSYAFPPDLRQQVNEQMARGIYASEDDLIREAFAALTWEQEEFEAVRQAVEALDAGDEGIDLNTAFDQLRQKHGIGSDG